MLLTVYHLVEERASVQLITGQKGVEEQEQHQQQQQQKQDQSGYIHIACLWLKIY
jgi:hypothetical protein